MTLTIGFVGLGVMGEPMCSNLARKSGAKLLGFDRSDAPFAALAPFGVERAGSLAELAAASDILFLALPSGAHVEAVCGSEDGLIAHAVAGQTIVDLGTSPIDLTRTIAGQFAAKGAHYADGPVARTRQAAEDGTLSIMVGADDATFARIRPLLTAIASDITHCGPVGAGQIVKILNNMVLVETVVALSEALAIAKRSGLDGALLFDTLTKGSADSFALRNHGLKAMIPDVFPERAFSTHYARKDIGYALALGRSVNVKLEGAQVADRMLKRAEDSGFGDLYWPVIAHVIAASQAVLSEDSASDSRT